VGATDRALELCAVDARWGQPLSDTVPVGPMADVEQSCDVYTIGNGTRQCPPLHAAAVRLVAASRMASCPCGVQQCSRVASLCPTPRARELQLRHEASRRRVRWLVQPGRAYAPFPALSQKPNAPSLALPTVGALGGWLAGWPNKYVATYCAGAVTAVTYAMSTDRRTSRSATRLRAWRARCGR
jgi:hypothetical protein